jgi:hypothetical protein
LAVVFWPEKPEPVYKGKKLSEWVMEPHGFIGCRGGGWSTEARHAISAIGREGIPFYLKWIGYEPGPFARAKLLITKKAMDWFNLHWQTKDSKLTRAEGAAFAFSVLGQDGKVAIPELLTYALCLGAPSRSRSAMASLGYMGDAAIPALISLTTNQNREVRMEAMELSISLGFDKSGMENLSMLLRHPDPAIRQDAETTVRWITGIRNPQ